MSFSWVQGARSGGVHFKHLLSHSFVRLTSERRAQQNTTNYLASTSRDFAGKNTLSAATQAGPVFNPARRRAFDFGWASVAAHCRDRSAPPSTPPDDEPCR